LILLVDYLQQYPDAKPRLAQWDSTRDGQPVRCSRMVYPEQYIGQTKSGLHLSVEAETEAVREPLPVAPELTPPEPENDRCTSS
jgi:hypothetical protein